MIKFGLLQAEQCNSRQWGKSWSNSSAMYKLKVW